MDFLDLHKQVIKNDQTVTSITIEDRSNQEFYLVTAMVYKKNNHSFASAKFINVWVDEEIDQSRKGI